MKTSVVLSILAILFVGGQSHPTKYFVDRNETCFSPTPAKIYSWHIHVLYWQNSQEHEKGALQLRDKFVSELGHLLGPDCVDLFHQDYACKFEPENYPAGPFLTAQWSIFFLEEHFNKFVPWFMQNRNGYDLLVHPNSGCEIEDHGWWAIWGGTPWQLDMSIFGHDQPWPWPEKDRMQQIRENQNKSEEESLLIKLFNRAHLNKQDNE